MCLVNKHTLIQPNERPKFNGRTTKAIYAVYENSRYEKGNYIADILYYNIYLDGGYKEPEKVIMVKELPADFHFMGKVINNKGRELFIKTFTIRGRDSANGSFTDESLDICGWTNVGQNGSFNWFRAEPYMEKEENAYVIDSDSDLGRAVANIIGKEYQVEEVEFWQVGAKMVEGSLDFATKFPYKHTPIQIYDGLVYPDEKLHSWRWLHGMPYRRPTDVNDKDNTNIRVWDADGKQHVYLSKAVDVEAGEEGLVKVTFAYKSHEIYGNEGNAYCNIHRYNKSFDYEYVRYEVIQIKDNEAVCKVSNSKSGKRKEDVWKSDLYRVVRISQSFETFPEEK